MKLSQMEQRALMASVLREVLEIGRANPGSNVYYDGLILKKGISDCIDGDAALGGAYTILDAYAYQLFHGEVDYPMDRLTSAMEKATAALEKNESVDWKSLLGEKSA